MREKAFRVAIILPVFLVSLLLQTTILPLLQLRGVMPDLLLVLIIFTGIFLGSVKGGAVGFAVGLLEDLLAGRYLGLGALSGFLAGYTVGYLEGKFYRENPVVPLFLVFLGSILFNGVFFTGREVIDTFSAAVPTVLSKLLLAALYNTFLAALLYRPFFRILFAGGSSLDLQSYGEFYR